MRSRHSWNNLPTVIRTGEQIKVETHKLLSLQELHRLKSLKATHRHIFICRASRSMLYQVSVVAVILSLLALNAWQFKRNRSMSDNDLKYRTILMMGSAQTQYLDTLETIFEYSRDLKRIRALRLQVQDYEYRVKAPRSETRTDATPGRRNRRTGVKNTVKNSYVVLICLCILLVLYLIKIIGYE